MSDIEELTIEQKISNAIMSIKSLPDLQTEVCGEWVWVFGETKQSKEELKALGFKWAVKKNRWYFNCGVTKKRYKGTWSMSKIREKHGSFKVRYKEAA